jgi:membrane fusion protein (multidrug efflux system)
MKLDFTVPAIYMRSLATGLPIVAKSRDLGDKVFNGEIFSIDNHIDEVTRAIRVRAILDNKNHELKQGMLMQVELNAAPRDAVLVSESALVPLGSNNFVFVLKEDAGSLTVERRQIQIGERLPGAVEVIEGVAAGEKLVTHGLQKIRTGQKVKILSEEASVAGQSGEKVRLSDLINTKSN